MTEEAPQKKTSWIKKAAARLFAILFGLSLAWFMAEVYFRVAFDSLPRETQGVLQHVRRVPWDDEHMIPVFPWGSSYEYQGRMPVGLDDYRVHWGDARFTFNTINLWGGDEGFRTREPEWPMNIVAFGDSFTFCWVDVEDCWVERLHSDYGWNVMNLSLPGTGALSHRNLLANYAPPMEPDVIIFQWFGNDYKDDYDHAIMRSETEVLDAPAGASSPPDFGSFAEYSAVYRLFRNWLNDRDQEDESGEQLTLYAEVNGREVFFSLDQFSHDIDAWTSVQYGYERTIEATQSAHDITTDEIGAEFVVLLIPTKEEVYADLLGDAIDADYVAMLRDGALRLLDECDARGWRCVDMLEPLKAQVNAGEHVYHAYDFHLNPLGNQVVSDTLAAYLVSEGLLESSSNR